MLVNHEWITHVKCDPVPRWKQLRCLDSLGYTKAGGMPADYMVRVKDSPSWYRIRTQCTGNGSTSMIVVGGVSRVVNLQEVKELWWAATGELQSLRRSS